MSRDGAQLTWIPLDAYMYLVGFISTALFKQINNSEIGILPSSPNTTNQTLPLANVTYQNFATGYPEAIITCPAVQGYYSCLE